MLILDGQQVWYQWWLCAVIVEEGFSPVAFLTGNGIFEPLVFYIVITLIACVLRFHDNTVTPTGIGSKQTTFLRIIPFNKINATAAHVWVQFEHSVYDVIHLVGIIQILYDKGGRISGGHVKVGRDATHLFFLTFQHTLTDAKCTYSHDSIG